MTTFITARIERMPASILSLDDAAQAVLHLARAGDDELVVTPNTDHFVRWKRSSSFRRYYGRAALVVLDGAPLVWLARCYGHRGATRVTGIDLFTEVSRRASEEGIAIAIIGGKPGVAERAAEVLRHRYPSISIPIAIGPSQSELEDDRYVVDLAASIRSEGVRIAALCLGSPKQEELRERLVAAGGTGAVCLGVGAAVDFTAGEVQRAPMLLRRTGLEWTYRLLNEPGRLWRRYLADAIYLLPSVVTALRYRLLHGAD